MKNEILLSVILLVVFILIVGSLAYYCCYLVDYLQGQEKLNMENLFFWQSLKNEAAENLNLVREYMLPFNVNDTVVIKNLGYWDKYWHLSVSHSYQNFTYVFLLDGFGKIIMEEKE